MAGLLDLLMQARESGRGARADLENSINYYIPPELRGLLGLAAEANPVVSMERAGQDAQRLVQPGLSGWDRMAAAGDMASNMAGVLAPMAAGRAVGMPAVRAAQEGLLGLSMTPEAAALRQFGIADEGALRYRRDASDIFGAGTTRAMYDDPATGGYMEMLERPDGPASTLELFVPEDMRGQGGGRRLLEEVMQNSPRMMGQVSSKAAAKTAYDAGRRPANMPNATLDDVFRMIDEDSSVNLMSQAELAARGILAPTDPATARGQEIMGMLKSGRAGEVTDQMLDLGDPVLNTRLNEYLYNNYDLPMDTASRMGRAQEMGFSNAYHGTGSNIAAVDPTYFGNGQDLLGSGFYTTTNPMRADRYVPREKTPNIEVSKEYGAGGNIIPLMVREPNAFRLDQPLGSAAEDIAASYAADPFFSVNRLSSGAIHVSDLDGKGFLLDPAQPRHWAVQNMRKTFGPSDTSNVLSEIGYSGIAGPEAAGQTVRASYNPADIRSSFARFDPRLSHLRNLNAALTAGVPLGLLAMQPEQEQY